MRECTSVELRNVVAVVVALAPSSMASLSLCQKVNNPVPSESSRQYGVWGRTSVVSVVVMISTACVHMCLNVCTHS